MSKHVDDSAIVFSNKADVIRKLVLVEDFGKTTAFKLNKDKTEWVAWKNPGGLVADNMFFGRGKFTIFLGALFSIDKAYDEYWGTKTKKIEDILVE